jgi:two-component sensor histidine kinase
MGALGAAIVQFTLGDDRETADLINQRMHALQATNDLITRAPAMEPDIESIVRHELAPYDLSRCALRGGRLPLRADIARSVGLIVHELTTNAVKYGALSNGHGRIEISWMKDREFLEMIWRESGVQNGGASTRVGFGTRLIEATVKGLNGTAEREFANGEFTCRISLRVAEHR